MGTKGHILVKEMRTHISIADLAKLCRKLAKATSSLCWHDGSEGQRLVRRGEQVDQGTFEVHNWLYYHYADGHSQGAMSRNTQTRVMF